jgi:hypothetical protein
MVKWDPKKPYSVTETQYFFFFKSVKILSWAYKSWGHDQIWHFLYPCKKLIELSGMLFLSSSPSSQNLKFIKRYPCLSSLITMFYLTQNCFIPLTRKILMWIFWVMLWSKSIPSAPYPAPGCYWSPPPPYLVILKMKF